MVGKRGKNRLPLAENWIWRSGIWLIIISLITILIATLHPVELDPRVPFSFKPIVARFELELISPHDTYIDYLRNILLFVPFGFGACILFDNLLEKSGRILVSTLVISISISLVVEIIQVWYPARIPSLRDVLANGLGGLLGFFIYLRWGMFILERIYLSNLRLKRFFTLKTLAVSYIAYIFLVSTGLFFLFQEAKLSGWDASYHLVVGNELTGDRPWKGTISELHIANQAFTNDQVALLFTTDELADFLGESLITSFEFEGSGNYHDKIGNLSDLKWQGTPPMTLSDAAVPVSEESWLSTTSPVSKLSEELVKSSQFTLITSVTPAEPEQWGAARIITISPDPANRNLTLEQVGKSLRVRFRTGVTSNNAMKPVIAIPDLFEDNAPHRLIITYNGILLSIYDDRPERIYTIALTPEVTLMHRLLRTRWYVLQIGSPLVTVYKIFFYGFVLVPVSLILSLLSARSEQYKKINNRLLLVGILLPVISLEAILASARMVNLLSLFISIVIIMTSFLATRNWARSSLRYS